MTGTFVGIALMFFGPLALALLLKRTGSLNLCFQVAVLGVAVLLAVVHVRAARSGRVLEAAARCSCWIRCRRPGIKIEGDRDAVIAGCGARRCGARSARWRWRRCSARLLLGRWWETLLRAPGAFGAEYRNLRLGIALGVTVTVVFVLAMAARQFR